MFDFDVRSGGSDGDLAEGEVLPRLRRIRENRDMFSLPVSSIPRKPPLIVTPSSHLLDCLEAMASHHTAVALVASHDVLLGVLSEREIVRRVAQIALSGCAIPVWKVMAPQTDTLLEGDTVAYALRKMSMRGGRPVPVLGSEGNLTGVLEAGDIVAWWCARTDAQSALPLEDYRIGSP